MENVVGSLRKGVSTRRQLANYCEHHAFVSCVEPHKVYEALEDSDWLNAMHEELNNFEYNKVWRLVPRPSGNHNVIGTKWIFKNKQDDRGQVIRNKARLVAPDFTQVEGFDFGETFVPVSRLESIRILLVLEDPLCSNDVVVPRWPWHQSPNFVVLEVVEFFMHGIEPIRVFERLIDLLGFNTRDKRMMFTIVS